MYELYERARKQEDETILSEAKEIRAEQKRAKDKDTIQRGGVPLGQYRWMDVKELRRRLIEFDDLLAQIPKDYDKKGINWRVDKWVKDRNNERAIIDLLNKLDRKGGLRRD